MERNEPKSKRSRVKRMAASGTLGLLVGLACQLAPLHWRMPCAILVKLIALFLGGAQ